MNTISVDVSVKYNVHVGLRILEQLGEEIRTTLPNAKKIGIITDSNVEPLYLKTVADLLIAAGFQVISYTFPAGEDSKNGQQYLTILSWLAENRLTRSDALVALGGGVVGDLTGFVAATYLRGVQFVQIPTTLLAMVDSSVGGKTGIDLPEGKNLAGAFYQPALVVCDINTLNTLPENVWRDGMAEVIKYGMLGNAELLRMLQGLFFDDLHGLVSVITVCISMKRDIVEQDEFDTGERMLLNLGHTIGHAVEQLSRLKISHGNAVAIGMAMITRAAVAKNVCPPACLHGLETLLTQYDLPMKTHYTAKDIFEATLQDKKRKDNQITEVIPVSVGQCELRKMPVEEMLEWIEMGLR